MRRKTRARTRRIASPDDYRRLAEESVARCFALPATHKRSRAVQLIMAKAWSKLADQTEEWRRDHRSAA
jgi:predicted ATPase